VGPAPLLAVAAALLEMQHYCPDLLNALTASVRTVGTASLPAGQLIDLLLVMAFFKTAPDDVVEDATGAVACALINQQQLQKQQQQEDASSSTSSSSSSAQAVKGPAAPDLPDRCEPLADDQIGRLLHAVLLLRSQAAPINAALAPTLAERPPERLLAADHLVADPELAADAMQQPQGPEWAAAGLFTPAQVVTRLHEGLGYEVEFGGTAGEAPLQVEVDLSVRVAEGGHFAAATMEGDGPGGGDDQKQEAAAEGGAAAAAAAASNPASKQVAIAVLDEETCYCPYPAGRLRGSVAVQVLALQAVGWGVVPLPVREWLALGEDTAAQDAYLKARIAAGVKGG